MMNIEKKIRKLVGDFDPALSPPSIVPVPKGLHRPKWSVMIPTFNCANYLIQTLESVLAEDLGPELMQIEVVDDCSTNDDPEAVVREIGKGRVQFYRKPKNEGAIRNFNTCIERSRGELVHILHGDDFILAGFYKKIEDLAEKYPENGLYATRCFYVDEAGIYTGISPRLEKHEYKPSNQIEDFLDGNCVQFAGSVVRREFFEKFGGFDNRLVHTADWEMWSRAIFYRGGIILADVLAAYRIFSANDTGRLMKTAENLRDRERLAMVLASRSSSFRFKDFNNINVKLSIQQEHAFRSVGDHRAACANRKFRISRADLKTNILQEMADIRSNLGLGTKIKSLFRKNNRP